MPKFVVLPGHEVCHAGETFTAGQEFELDEDTAAYHVEAGSARPFFEPVDRKKGKGSD